MLRYLTSDLAPKAEQIPLIVDSIHAGKVSYKDSSRHLTVPRSLTLSAMTLNALPPSIFPKLTTINTNVDQLSSEALDYLMRMIKGQVQIGASAKKTLIPVELVVRDTDKRGKNDKHT